MEKLCLEAPEFVVETDTALVLKVARTDGNPVALKLYKAGYMGNEMAGVRFLAEGQGRGAAQVYKSTSVAIVLEWLKGPLLTEIALVGNDGEAVAELAKVALCIRAAVAAKSFYCPTLEMVSAPLFR